MKDKVSKKLQSRNFSFMQLLKMQTLAEELAQEMYAELDIEDKVQLVWQVKVTADDTYLGALFEQASMKQLTQLFIEALQKLAEGATVSFTEKPVMDLPKEMPPTPKRIAKKQVDPDGTNLPKGMERV